MNDTNWRHFLLTIAGDGLTLMYLLGYVSGGFFAVLVGMWLFQMLATTVVVEFFYFVYGNRTSQIYTRKNIEHLKAQRERILKGYTGMCKINISMDMFMLAVDIVMCFVSFMTGRWIFGLIYLGSCYTRLVGKNILSHTGQTIDNYLQGDKSE